jgi:hypothetical protein
MALGPLPGSRAVGTCQQPAVPAEFTATWRGDLSA